MDEPTFLASIQAGQVEAVRQALAEQPGLANACTEGGLSAVLLAAYYGHAPLARLLAEQRSDLTIFEASVVGDLLRLRTLVAAEPGSVNAYASDGFQPLGLAAFFGQATAAAFLVEQGARVNSPSANSQRVTPLHSAAASGSLEITRLLLEHGADPDARQEGDFVALHAAAQNGQVEMIDLLLAHGAELNPRNADGQTPLAIARQAGQAAAADRLLRQRAIE